MAETAEQPQVNTSKNELVNPRTISKKHDSAGRSATAASIMQARKEGRTIRTAITGNEQQSQQNYEQFDALTRQEKQKAAELTERNEKLLVRLKSKLGIGDKKAASLEAQLASVRQRLTELNQQSARVWTEREELQHKQAETPDPKQLLAAYYEKIKTTPLTNQEKKELLIPEVLENLTTEEYIALWRRLNPYFVAHVTRQGFRDHFSHNYHTGHLNEFQNGFVGVLEDEKMLRPPMAVKVLKNRDQETIKTFLRESGILEAKTHEEARSLFNQLFSFSLSSAPLYPDITAVHFAATWVADEAYGGESNNELFFVYPADVIASQYNYGFSWPDGNFVRPVKQGEGVWNDVFVWPNNIDNPGISVDSGIVFLPETTPVDPATGSKYASEIKIVDGKEVRAMVEDTQAQSTFTSFVKGLTDESIIKRAFRDYSQERRYYEQQDARRVCLKTFLDEIQKLGINSDAVPALAYSLFANMSFFQTFPDELIEEMLKDSGAKWKRAERAVPAREYWEHYFSQHPQVKPKHIVYYDGGPTNAVYAFQQKNDIGKANTSGTDGPFLGFEDHRVTDMENDPRANKGYSELLELGNRIIAEHFGAQVSAVA